MLDLNWNDDARAQLAETFAFVSVRNTKAAERLLEMIGESLERVRRFPAIGRPGRIAGTRELIVHPNYIVVFRIGDATIDVLRVLHVRQRYP